jgi:negative regulator of replication initiation
MNEEKLIKEIATATAELEAAQDVIRTLAKDLADVADVIEPVLLDHAKRIRQARMTTIDEIRQSVQALREYRDFLASEQTQRAIDRGKQLVAVCTALEEFRMCGFLDAYLKAVIETTR